MAEDAANGQLVCIGCGLSQTLLHSTYPDHHDMEHATHVKRSQHKPSAYVMMLIRKFDIATQLQPELEARYRAVIFWCRRIRPPNRKSMPN